MLPLSLGRTPTAPSPRNAGTPAVAWLRPANITAANRTELRALIVWLALFVGLAVAIGLAYVWLRLRVVDVGYHLSATRQLIEKLEQEGHELSLDAARLDAPGRLEDVARTRLGMMRPEKGQEGVLP